MTLSMRERARLLARAVPDLLVLFRRLLRDGRVPLGTKALVALTVVYLVSPLDLVPDVIPVLGQLDDALVAVFALRRVVRVAGPEIVAEHWPGPARSLAVVLRLGG